MRSQAIDLKVSLVVVVLQTRDGFIATKEIDYSTLDVRSATAASYNSS
jgi:hypothetical protein